MIWVGVALLVLLGIAYPPVAKIVTLPRTTNPEKVALMLLGLMSLVVALRQLFQSNDMTIRGIDPLQGMIVGAPAPSGIQIKSVQSNVWLWGYAGGTALILEYKSGIGSAMAKTVLCNGPNTEMDVQTVTYEGKEYIRILHPSSNMFLDARGSVGIFKPEEVPGPRSYPGWQLFTRTPTSSGAFYLMVPLSPSSGVGLAFDREGERVVQTTIDGSWNQEFKIIPATDPQRQNAPTC